MVWSDARIGVRVGGADGKGDGEAGAAAGTVAGGGDLAAEYRKSWNRKRRAIFAICFARRNARRNAISGTRCPSSFTKT
jgi:hypothetical protein